MWLTKPLMGAGGAAIQRTAAGADEPPPAGHYLQRLVAGRVLGAHFVCEPTATRLLGITASWVADEWLAPREFIYRGSWGPLSLEQLEHGRQEPDSQSIEHQVVEIAEHLRHASGILGWLQLDLILDRRGDLWLIDVNPRWSAGMEVLLDSGQCNPLLDHLQAYGFALADGQLVDRREQPLSPTFEDQPAREPACSDLRNNSAVRCLSAKGVVYACESFRCTAEMLQRWQALPDVADIPSASMAGSIVQAGEPLMTVKASVATPCDEGEAKQQLLQQLNEAREKLLADIQPARI